jgi:uncharacterized protein (TIGR02266 family)
VVRVKFRDKKQLRTCYAKDISRGGIFLRTTNPLPVFEKITIVLELPGGEEVELRGEVVRAIEPEKAGPVVAAGMGVQFIDLTPDKRAFLEAYLERVKTAPPASAQTLLPRGPAMGTARSSMEEMVHGLRRLLWVCADATQLAGADYYELLGIQPGAGVDEIKAACDLLRVLCDPSNPPPGVEARDAGERCSALLMVLADIQDCLTDPERRLAYDAARTGILR